MKKSLLTAFALSGFVSLILGSEKNAIYAYTAYLREQAPLVSCDKKYIDFFNKTCGTQCKYDEPFLEVFFDAHSIGRLANLIVKIGRSDRPEDWLQAKEDIVRPLVFLPFCSFVKWGTGFKQPCDMLLSFSRKEKNEEKDFLIVLDPEFTNRNPQFYNSTPQQFLDEFKNRSKMIIDFLGQDEEYKQKITGHSGTAEEPKIRAEQKAKQSALFYSRLKKFLCGSIGIIAIYVLYKKLYAATS